MIESHMVLAGKLTNDHLGRTVRLEQGRDEAVGTLVEVTHRDGGAVLTLNLMGQRVIFEALTNSQIPIE